MLKQKERESIRPPPLIAQASDATAPRFLEGEDALRATMRARLILAEKPILPVASTLTASTTGLSPRTDLNFQSVAHTAWLDTMLKIVTMALSRGDSSVPC